MAKDNGPVCRKCRREGEKLFLKGDRCYSVKCSVERRAYGPGMHGKRRKKESEYLIHLKEKQKVRTVYGVLESQFRKTYRSAEKMKGVTGNNLLSLLERRLDNVLYNMGLANSRAEARQMIGHRHVIKNGIKANIPSMLVYKGDVISLKEKSKAVGKFKENADAGKRREAPSWLEVDVDNFKGVVKELPTRDTIALKVNERLIVEWYSR